MVLCGMDAPLRLVAVEAGPLHLPLRHPMRLASETVAVAETLLVRVVDDTGREGWGEASSAPTMTGDLLPGMVAAVERFLAPALLAAVVPDVGWGVSLTHATLAEDVVAVPVVISGGMPSVPPGPDHGAVPDAARLERRRWRSA
jgi:L-alanine-DL-glutamate epimerase-like enolase superfamily enzyme